MVIMPILLFGVTSITYASGEVAWENPIQIAGPANLNYPNLVVDSKGQVHLFWGQGDLDSKLTNAIYYSKIGEKEYFMGTDILVTPNSNTASTPVVTLSPDNFIHVVWIGDRSLWHSKAPIELADKVRSWSTPNRIDGPTVPSTTARLISSPDGTLHLTYILFFGDKSSIIYMKSVDLYDN
jgi:hypothetical protein